MHYFTRMRGWWRHRRNNNNNQREQEQVQIGLDQEYADDLEERLNRVYLRLIQVNANNRRHF